MFLQVDEDDMQRILPEIKAVHNVENLGLALSVCWSTNSIERIQKDNQSIKNQKIQVIYHWLTRTDIIRGKQSILPKWSELADAVNNENAALSKNIRCKYYQ